MHSGATDASTPVSEVNADPNTAYANEINALHHWLGADKTDLGRLLEPLRGADVTPQQVYALLKQAWLRVQDLRDRQADLTASVDSDSETVSRLERAFRHLQAGEGFSPDEGDAAFDQTAQRALEAGLPAAKAAAVIAAHAQLAAARFDHRRAGDLYSRAAVIEGLDTPLQWRYELKRAAALTEQGRDFPDRSALEEALGLFENQVLPLAPREERPADWAETHHQWAEALGILGLQQRGTRLLEQSIAHYKEGLAERTREAMPSAWAATQNGLGHVMGVHAQRTAETEMLEKAVQAFEAALEVRTLEETPQEWAIAQNNLGGALLNLGNRKKDESLLERARDAYRAVLKVWTRERAPLDWAMAQHNLATALRTLGECGGYARILEASVTAYQEALSERSRERTPMDWAMTQNNLGAALHKLGECQEDPQTLEVAMGAYDNALQEWTRERGPVTWAMTLANKAAARKALAQLTRDVAQVRQARSDFQTLGEVFRSVSHAQYYELAVEQVAVLQKLEQELVSGTAPRA